MLLTHTVALVIAFSLITFLHVVLGELAPKAVALDRPGPVILVCARPLLSFARALRPVLSLMNGAGNAVVRAFGVHPAGSQHAVHSPDELSLLVDEAREAAAEMLRAGGNAFDAALAAGFAASLAEPMYTSLGGGGFLLAREQNGRVTLFDFFADTPGLGRSVGDLQPHFVPVTVQFPGSPTRSSTRAAAR